MSKGDKTDNNSKEKQIQKEHPKLLNPAKTIKIIPSKINEIKEEAVEESLDPSQLKKNILKIIIPDNSNEENEPSTSGSKNTPSSTPILNVDKIKVDEVHNVIQNKENNNDIKEDIIKETIQLSMRDSYDKVFKEKKKKKKQISPVNENFKKYKSPLTCNNKYISNFKYDFTKKEMQNAKQKEMKLNEDKKMKKVKNVFRIGNKNYNMNKQDKINKQETKNIIKKDISEKKSISSPRSTSLISFKTKNNIKNNSSPIRPLQKKEATKNILVNGKTVNDKNMKKSRAKSVKFFSQKKRNYSERINNEIKNKDIPKKYSKSLKNKKETSLSDNNKLFGVKTQLETEFNNLIKILPENFEDIPEIKSNFDLIIKNINGLKDYIHKNKQIGFIRAGYQKINIK